MHAGLLRKIKYVLSTDQEVPTQYQPTAVPARLKVQALAKKKKKRSKKPGV